MFLSTEKLISMPRVLFLTELWEVKAVAQAYLNILNSNLMNNPEDGIGLVLGIDTETTGLHLQDDRVILFSAYIPDKLTIPSLEIYDEDATFTIPGPCMHRSDFLEAFAPLICSPNVLKCGSNLNGFDYFMFLNHGFGMCDPIHDTAVMDWLHNENYSGRHGLKQSMLRYYNYRMQDYQDAGGKEADIRNWTYKMAKVYPARDAWTHYKLWEFLQGELRKFSMYASGLTAWDFYKEFMVPVQKVLRNMMRRGIKLDIGYLNKLAPTILKEVEEIEYWFNTLWVMKQAATDTFYITDSERRIDKQRKEKGLPMKVVGVRPLNLKSTQQLRYLYFDLYDKPVLKKTKPGKEGTQSPSLSKEVLEEYIAGGCGMSEKLLEHRTLTKLYGTYIGDEADDEEKISKRKEKGGLRAKIRKGRIHTHFKMGPVTGRLASSGPNLMNIPARTELGRKIRKAFCANKGWKLLVADYEQLEMRLFAHFSEEPDMIHAIMSGRDLHCFTASLMFKVPYEHLAGAKKDHDGDPEGQKVLLDPSFQAADYDFKQLLKWRQAAKTIGFGLTKTYTFA